MSNLQADGWHLDDVKYVQLSPEELATWKLSQGDIIFNRTNSKELVGKCEVFNEEGVWVFASYLMRLRVNTEKALPEFVTAFLNTGAGRLQINRESRQIIGMSNINANELRSLRIPLPRIQEQKKLICILDAARIKQRQMLAEADALLAGLDSFILKLIGLQDSYIKVRHIGAVLRCNLEGPLNAERYLENSPAAKLDPWQSISLDRAFDVIEEKVTPERDDPNAMWECVRIDDVENEPIDPPTPRYLRGAELSGSFFRIRDYDLLVARLGPPLLNGKIIVARDCNERSICSPEFLVFRPTGGYDADAGMWILRSGIFRRVLYSRCRGSTPSRYRLIREDLGSILLPKVTGRKREELLTEVAARRTSVRRLRAEAALIWEKAKVEFETALLGPLEGEL